MTPHQAFWLARRATPAELRKMREALGFTQEDWAYLMRVTPQTVLRMEKGRTGINFCTEVLLRGMHAQESGIRVVFRDLAKRLAAKS